MAQPRINILGNIVGTFTVNLAVNEVQITGTPNLLEAAVGAGLRQYFNENDNFNLVSVWLTLPYCFCSGNTDHLRIQIRGQDTVPNTFGLNVLPLNGWQWIPTENVETGLNTFVPWDTTPFADPWGLYCEADGYVSMINAPAALDGETLDVWGFAKVEHNQIAMV